MGSLESTQTLVVGFVKETEKTHHVDSAWRVSQTRLVLSVIVEYLKRTAKDVQFTETLNIGKDVALSNSKQCTYKCCVDPELQLLSMESDEWCGVVDMKSKKQILDLPKKDDVGEQASQWVTIEEHKYLAVQLSNKKISMLKVVPDKDTCYKFVDDETYAIVARDTIYYCDFARDFQTIVLVVAGNTLELRSMSDCRNIKKRIELETRVARMALRCLQLSADGKQCVVSGGNNYPYFSVVDLVSGNQRRFKSNYLQDAYAPCFINGEADFVFVGACSGKMEVWDIATNQVIKNMELKALTGRVGGIKASLSTQNILAVGSRDKIMRLY